MEDVYHDLWFSRGEVGYKATKLLDVSFLFVQGSFAVIIGEKYDEDVDAGRRDLNNVKSVSEVLLLFSPARYELNFERYKKLAARMDWMLQTLN